MKPLKRLLVIAMMLSMTSCAVLRGPTPPAIDCPIRPVWVKGERAGWSAQHSRYMATVIREGIKRGCWQLGEDFTVDQPSQADVKAANRREGGPG